jgi:hypothetical protein
MLGLSYERLDRITRTMKPYRGSLDRFPLTTRKQNTKNFYVREKNGVRVFDVVYGDRTKSTSLTHEEYLEMKSLGIPKLHEYKYHNGKTEYWLYETVRHVLGTVYPEGFFQFNKDINEFGQGDRAILSEFSSGWFTNDTRRGGMIWTNGRGSGLQVIPIYKGARFSTTNIPHIIDDYEVIGRKVNRKVGKDILGGYESFYKTAETMCKAMSEDMFLDIAKEVLNDCKDKYYETAESLRDQSPLDAMILYCVALDIGRIPYRANHRNWYHSTPHEDFNSLKRTLNKRIYKENPEVFTPVRYFKGEAFPPSIWGYEIEVNGQKVDQY